MSRLRVVHQPPGYEGWKDETTINRPNWVVIGAILLSVFCCGGLVATASFFAFMQRDNKQVAQVPTLAILSTETPIPTEPLTVIQATHPPTITPAPTNTPILETTATPDLNATLSALIAQQNATQELATQTLSVSVEEIVFCEGAPFQIYQHSDQLKVTFEDVGALRVLDRPREPDKREPDVLKQLYDGDTVVIQGDPVCGQWLNAPVIYFPVFVPRWQVTGYVGFGQNDDVWLAAR